MAGMVARAGGGRSVGDPQRCHRRNECNRTTEREGSPMTAHVLASGALYRDSEQQASKSDNPFVAVTLRAKDGDATLWRKVIVFSKTARAEFLRLTSSRQSWRWKSYCSVATRTS
jgi:hypothetical protein